MDVTFVSVADREAYHYPNLCTILVREGGRQHKAWGEGAAGTPGKRQMERASPRSGRQTLADC